tara:strand:+ start:2252 stop:2518 length:267 start_codon:yes stop_codon:yes gene_type:complete
MSTSSLKYVILPYEGSVEKLVDVRKTIPQNKIKYEDMRKFLNYVYLLEEIALSVGEQNYDKANKDLKNLKNGEFVTFKATIKKENKDE